MQLTLLLVVLIVMAVAVAATFCWWLLYQWQMKILRREQGDQSQGFPVVQKKERK